MWTSAPPAWTADAPERGPGERPERASARQIKKHNMLRCEPPTNHYILWFSA